MNGLICSVVSYLVNALWQVPLIAAAGWIICRLQKRLGPQSQHVTWVVTLGFAILTPALPLWRALVIFPTVSGGSSIAMVPVHGGLPGGRGIAQLPPAIILILFCCYLCLSIYFALRFAWSLYWTTMLVQESRSVSLGADGDAIWGRCKQLYSLENAVILNSQRVSGPITVWLGRPVLLVPAAFFLQCTPSDLLSALGHECAHMRRRDFQKNLFYEAASLLIAFHPVTWLLKSQIAQTREMICDAIAIERLIDSQSYTQSLLRLATMIVHASPVSTSHAIGIFDANILEKRIMHIKAGKRNASLVMKCGLFFPGALLLCSIAAGAAKASVAIEPQAQSADQANAPAQIYHVGGDVSAPKVISYKDPVYPKSARETEDTFDGTCVLSMVVDTSGMPRDIRVARSLGPDFDANAIDAVRQYRFAPAMRFGTAVPVAVHMEVKFRKY